MSLTQDLRWSVGRSIALQLQRQTDLLLCTINCFLQWDHLPNMAVGDLAFYYTLYLWMNHGYFDRGKNPDTPEWKSMLVKSGMDVWYLPSIFVMHSNKIGNKSHTCRLILRYGLLKLALRWKKKNSSVDFENFVLFLTYLLICFISPSVNFRLIFKHFPTKLLHFLPPLISKSIWTGSFKGPSFKPHFPRFLKPYFQRHRFSRGGGTRMTRGGIRLVHGHTKSTLITYFSGMKIDPKYAFLHAFFLICPSCPFQNLSTWPKTHPFFQFCTFLHP